MKGTLWIYDADWKLTYQGPADKPIYWKYTETVERDGKSQTVTESGEIRVR